RLALPDEGGLVLAWPGQVAVEAVIADVDLAAGEPLGVRLVPHQDLVPALEPVQRRRLFGPEALGGVVGAPPELLVVGRAVDVGLGGETGRRGELARLLEHAGDV